eukprot:TRINITY_DN56353_c0_g1_i1.p1 TRINITY_DN56353_c0_g1~~TRINITY_DN56353_c0_g1_i1.p1  ORF type:complete len:440 (+),score=75.70 TRINITY_DN56353_c0_g1_i1:103-1422(+)
MLSLKFLRPARRLLISNVSKDNPRLFTPGPLTTSHAVKSAMLVDYGSRDPRFMRIVSEVRSGVLQVARVPEEDWECIPLQGSGSMGLEAVIGSMVPPKTRVAIFVNGAYGERAAAICTALGIPFDTFVTPEDTPPDPSEAAEWLQSLCDETDKPPIGAVCMVQLETTSGVVNDVVRLAAVARAVVPDAFVMVDAMSAFGCLPLPLAERSTPHIHFVVSSSNKCIQGVPGFSLVVAHKDALKRMKGWSARSFTLDLNRQVTALNRTGQFPNTPPTHTIVAFHQALKELDQEGGAPARLSRYTSMQRRLVLGLAHAESAGQPTDPPAHDSGADGDEDGDTACTTGMAARLPGGGFDLYLRREVMSPVITTFLTPKDAHWNFERFYEALAARGMMIYPGKLTKRSCFRIGTIGDLSVGDVDALVQAVHEEVGAMGLESCRAE